VASLVLQPASRAQLDVCPTRSRQSVSVSFAFRNKRNAVSGPKQLVQVHVFVFLLVGSPPDWQQMEYCQRA